MVECKHEVPLPSSLVDIHLQNLVLGKGHLIEAVKDSGGGPRRCRKRTVTFLRVEVALVLDAPLSLFPSLYDEGDFSGFLALSPAFFRDRTKQALSSLT